MLLDQRLRDYQSKTLPKSKWKIRHNLKAQTHYSSTLLQESPTHWSTRTQRKVFWWTQGTGRCPARTLWGNWDRRRLQKIRSFRQNLRLWFFSGSFGCEENRQLRCNRQLRSREGLSFWFFFLIWLVMHCWGLIDRHGWFWQGWLCCFSFFSWGFILRWGWRSSNRTLCLILSCF